MEKKNLVIYRVFFLAQSSAIPVRINPENTLSRIAIKIAVVDDRNDADDDRLVSIIEVIHPDPDSIFVLFNICQMLPIHGAGTWGSIHDLPYVHCPFS